MHVRAFTGTRTGYFNVEIRHKLFVWERDQPPLTWPTSTVLSIRQLLPSIISSTFAEMKNSSIALCRAILRHMNKLLSYPFSGYCAWLTHSEQRTLISFYQFTSSFINVWLIGTKWNLQLYSRPRFTQKWAKCVQSRIFSLEIPKKLKYSALYRALADVVAGSYLRVRRELKRSSCE